MKKVFQKPINSAFYHWCVAILLSSCLASTPARAQGEDCNSPILINTFPYTASGTTCGKNDDYTAQCNSIYGSGEDVVYQIDIATAGAAIITVTTTDGSNGIGWFLKDAISCSAVTPCLATAMSETSNMAANGFEFGIGTYYLVIDTKSPSACAAYTIDITDPVPMATSIEICSGQYAELSAITAGGIGTCTMQWQSSTDGSSWNDIVGETNPTYTTPSLTQTTYYRAYYNCTGNGCSQSYSNVRVVTVNPLPTPIASSNSPICEGTDLQLSVDIIGIYAWEGPNGYSSTDQNPVISNALQSTHEGTYTVTVTDANTCSSSTTVSVTIHLNPTLTTSATDSDCIGAGNGTATATPTSGTSPYTYLWNDTQTTATATALPPNTYTVTITDANTCTASATVIVSEPTQLTAMSTPVAVSCFGGSDGSVSVTISGGIAGYSYEWSNNATTEDINNVSAGTYTLTVTDANGCNATTNAIVTEPNLLSVTTTSSAVSCFSGNNGSIDATIIGGTLPYSYAWDNSETTEDLNNLVVGTYILTVTDGNGCSTTTTTIVTEPTLLTTTATATSVSCFSGNNGSIDVVTTGGTINYSYLWDNGETTEDLNNLVAGTYQVTITDANNCVTTTTATITQPDLLTATATATPVSCFSGDDGSIAIDVAGGTTAYTYAWNNGSTDEDLTNLNAGSYTVTITDANNCSTATTAIITEPTVLNLSNTHSAVSCNGGNNGTIDLIVTGGTITYTYNWSNGATDEDLNGLTAGTYTVTTTDSNGCSATNSATITEPTLLTATITPTMVSCNGNNNGSADLEVTGGVTAYNYSWSNGTTDEDLSTITAGDYTVTITDANNCTTTASTTITQPDLLTASVVTTNANCDGGADGAADLSIIGGTLNYTIAWSNGETTEDLANIGAGSYTAVITDANGCSTSIEAIISTPSGLSVDVSSTNISCNGNNDGSIDLTVAGGVTDYTFAWSNANTTEDATSLAAGSYTITVTDANNCIAIANVVLTEPAILTANATASDVLCNGGNTANIDAIVQGGTTNYTYNWSNGSTNEDLSSLVAGTYTLTVTDANNCTTTTTATVNEPSVLSINATTIDNTCFQSNDGAIDANVSGGINPYTYTWNNGGTTEDPSSLSAGTYTLTVTDANNCTTSAVYTIIQPDLLTAIAVTTPIACNGGNEGAIDMTISGGTSPYAYAWNNGETTEDLSSIIAGNYSVTITDVNNCTFATATTITQPNALTTTVSTTPASCNGGTDGSVDLTVNGGTSSYTFAWSNGETTEDLNNIAAGTYQVTVTDANNCTSTIIANVNTPSGLVLNYTTTEINCNGDTNGAININPTGGTPAYTFAWSNGETTEDLNGLGANTYTITLTDANNCSITSTITLTEPEILSLSANISSDVLCNGSNEGQIDLTVTGGTAGYNFDWSNGATTEDLSNLTANLYEVTVTDANNCTATIAANVIQPNAIQVDMVASSALCNGSNGGIDVTVSGGTNSYTFAWSNGAITEDINNIAAGTYTITVTDSNGCSNISSIDVQQPTTLSIAVNTTNALCTGGNGNIDLTITGGAGGYTFLWNTTATTEDLSNLNAGLYSVTVTDSNNCTATTDINITTPDAIDISHLNNLPNCNGDSNGSINLSVVGGTPSYSFSWSNGATTEDISNLVAGTYTVTVTDGNACLQTYIVNLSEPAILTVNASGTAVNCAGGSDGTATAQATGGTAPYQYIWSTGSTNSTVSGLAVGTYSITIVDVNACTTSTTVTITEPATLVATIGTITNASCDGTPTGGIDINVTGGTSPYSYVWSNGATIQDLTNVGGGLYAVTITDAHACTKVISNIDIPLGLFVNVTGGVVDVGCGGGDIGSVDVTPTGGLAPYTYIWSNGATTEDISNVGIGTYIVTISDVNGCSATTSATVIGSSPLIVELTQVNDISCNNDNNGSIDITPIGGTPPYSYAWSNGATSQDVSNLSEGTYTVTITGGNGCTATNSATMTNPPPLDAFVAGASNITCAGNADGFIDVQVTGGTLPYTFIWNNGATSEDQAGLSPGPYGVQVTDANGCTKITGAVIKDVDPLLAVIDSIYNVGCANGSSGAIFAHADGGTAAGLGYSFLWNTGATTEDIANLSVGTYTVTVTDQNGCTTSNTASVALSEVPIIASATPSCDANGMGMITVLAQAVPNTNSLLYSLNGSTFQASNIFTNVINGTYTITVRDANTLCQSTISGITVSCTCAASASNTGPICQGQGNVTINAIIGGASYVWSGPSGFSSTNSSATVSQAGTYTVTITYANGCSATATTAVQINTLPTITTVNVACSGGVGTGSIDIVANSTPTTNGVEYSIDGTNYQNFNVFSGLGNGTYTIFVRDKITACVRQQSNVTINCIDCTNTTSASNNGPICSGNTLQLSAPAGGISYAWNGSGGSFTQQNPSIFNATATAAGIYTVTVTFSNGCTATATTVAVVNAAPTLTNAVVTCNANGTATITVVANSTPTTNGLSYSLGGFTFQNSNTFSGISNGTYLLILRDNVTNCQTVSNVVVNCGSCSGVAVTASSNSPVCQGSAINFTCTPSGGTPSSFAWSGPGGGSSLQNPIISNATTAKAGVYTVTVTFSNGCTATATTNVVVYPKANILSVIKSCNGTIGTITVTAQSNPSTNGVQYSLNGTVYQTSGTFTNLPSGSYSVYVRDNVTNCVTVLSTQTVLSCGGGTCSATATNSGPVCPGSSIQLFANPAGALSYAWGGPSGSSSLQNPIIPNMTPAKVGTYTVTVTFSGGCTATATTTLSLKTQPTVSIGAGGPTTFCEGGSVFLNATASGGTTPYTFAWSNGATTQGISATTSGVYIVTVTNSVGCTRTASQVVNVTVCCQADAGTMTVTNEPCPDEPLIASAGGYNATANYAFYYILSDGTNVLAVNTTGVFETVGMSSGNYMVYGYNVKIAPTAGGVNPPTVGMTLAALSTGSCAAISSAPVSVNINELPTGPLVLGNVTEGETAVGPFTYNTATIEITGGLQPYSYDWNTEGYVRFDIAPNEAGDGVIITIYYTDDANWSCTVSDSNGCTNDSLDFDNNPDGGGNGILDIDSFEVSETTNEGEATGTITLHVSGGDFSCGEYTYEWYGPEGWSGTYSTTGGNDYLLEGLPTGWYAVTVTDCSGAITEGWYWVPEGTRGRTRASIIQLMRAYPNPFDAITNLQFMVNDQTRAFMAVYTPEGKLVQVLFKGYAEKSRVYEVSFDGSRLPVGMYLVTLITETGFAKTEKLILNRQIYQLQVEQYKNCRLLG